MIVEDIIHSGIPNYTKLAFISLKMIRNRTVSQPIKRGIILHSFSANQTGDYLTGMNAANVYIAGD